MINKVTEFCKRLDYKITVKLELRKAKKLLERLKKEEENNI